MVKTEPRPVGDVAAVTSVPTLLESVSFVVKTTSDGLVPEERYLT